MEPPPSTTAYVVTAVEVGHLLQWRFYRQDRGLTAHLAARVKLAEGEVKGTLAETGVETALLALGAHATDESAPFSVENKEDFERNFGASPDAAVPVRIEYTAVRGREGHGQALSWRPGYVARVSPQRLSIDLKKLHPLHSMTLALRCVCNGDPIPTWAMSKWQDTGASTTEGREDPTSRVGLLSIGGLMHDRTYNLTEKRVDIHLEEGDVLDCAIEHEAYVARPYITLPKHKQSRTSLPRIVVGQDAVGQHTKVVRGEWPDFTLPVNIEVRPESGP